MYKFLSLTLLGLAQFVAIADAQTQTFQDVTNNGNATTNLLQITGFNHIPTTGSGLELYGNTTSAVVQAFNRNAYLPIKLYIQPNVGSLTSINEAGGRLLVNSPFDDGATPLQVNGGVSFTSVPVATRRGMKFTQDEFNGGRCLITLDANNGDFAGMDYFYMEHYAGLAGARLLTANAAPLKFGTADADRMIIDASGNVGIGTMNPDTKLTVNGTVHATKVKVTQTVWPDFVFQETYKRPTLQELESFIRQHRRLPDIPSEAEVKKNGVDVADSQAKLLQKVEELTLYIIELNKKIEVQDGQIRELQKKKSK